MAAIFGGNFFFLKIGSATQQSYPTDQNFLSDQIFVEIALSSTVCEIQAFLKKKFENSKWPPFLASEIVVETWKG